MWNTRNGNYLCGVHTAATRPYWQTHSMFIVFILCFKLLHYICPVQVFKLDLARTLQYMCHEHSTSVCLENALIFFFAWYTLRA